MQCKNCGGNVNDLETICPHCGEHITRKSKEQVLNNDPVNSYKKVEEINKGLEHYLSEEEMLEVRAKVKAYQNKEKKKTKRIVLIVCAIVAAMLALFVILFLVFKPYAKRLTIEEIESTFFRVWNFGSYSGGPYSYEMVISHANHGTTASATYLMGRLNGSKHEENWLWNENSKDTDPIVYDYGTLQYNKLEDDDASMYYFNFMLDLERTACEKGLAEGTISDYSEETENKEFTSKAVIKFTMHYKEHQTYRQVVYIAFRIRETVVIITLEHPINENYDNKAEDLVNYLLDIRDFWYLINSSVCSHNWDYTAWVDGEIIVPATCINTGLLRNHYCGLCGVIYCESVGYTNKTNYTFISLADCSMKDLEITYDFENPNKGIMHRECADCGSKVEVYCNYNADFVLNSDQKSYSVNNIAITRIPYEEEAKNGPEHVLKMEQEWKMHVNNSFLVIPEGYNDCLITTIGSNAFVDCPDVRSVVITGNITDIADSAFEGFESLTDVYYTGTEEEWNTILIGTNNDALTKATIHFNYVLK